MLSTLTAILLAACVALAVVPLSDRFAGRLAIRIRRILASRQEYQILTPVRLVLTAADRLFIALAVMNLKRVLFLYPTHVMQSNIQSVDPEMHDVHANKLSINWNLADREWSDVRKIIVKKVLNDFPSDLDKIDFMKLTYSGEPFEGLKPTDDDEHEIPRYVVSMVDRVRSQLPKLHEETITYDELLQFAEARGISVDFKPLPKQVRSMLFYFKGKGYIVINDECRPGARWYLLGFELGHDLLHYHHQINLPSLSRAADYLNNIHYVAQADYFAQCTFFPRKQLKRLCEEYNFDWDLIAEKMLQYCEERINPGGFLNESTRSLVKKKMGNRLYYDIKYFFPEIWMTNKPPQTHYT
jgi:hypothetical protein